MTRIQLATCSAVTALLAVALAGPATTQGLKSGTLTLVVPFAAGGPSDVAGRILAQGMADVLARPSSWRTRSAPAAPSARCACRARRRTASQFVLGNNGTHSWSQSLYKNPPYDAVTDFTPLGLAVESPRAHHRAEQSARQHAAGVHRLCEGEPVDRAVRLGRTRLGVACELHPAQRHARRERHPRSLSRALGRRCRT